MTRAAHPRRTVARSLVREQSRKLIAVLERELARERIELGGARAFAVGGEGRVLRDIKRGKSTSWAGPKKPGFGRRVRPGSVAIDKRHLSMAGAMLRLVYP